MMNEHKCFCSNCTKPNICPKDAAINQYNAVVKQNKQLQQDLLSCEKQLKFSGELIKHLHQTILAEGKENPTCPSYDFGSCETQPMPFDVKCKNLPECKSKTMDFTQYEFVKGEWIKKEKQDEQGENHE